MVFGASLGLVVNIGFVDVDFHSDGIKFVLDDGSDLGSSYWSFYYSNYGKLASLFLDYHLNTMMELYLIYMILK